MKITLVCAGKLKERSFRELADEYKKRIERYVPLREIETKDETGLLRALPPGARVVTLEVHGKQLSSEGFAERLARFSEMGKGDVVFVIGAADGIPPEVRAVSDEELSLSTMTLPHRLARVLLLEQIYRGLSILRGEPYAREG